MKKVISFTDDAKGDIQYAYNYNEFCNSDKDEALRMIATETIHGVEKHLSKTKEINYEQFHNDLVKLFRRERLMN